MTKTFDTNLRKGCRGCEHYSTQLLRCKLGHINPPTIKGGVDAARFMGIDYLCPITIRGQKARQKAREVLTTSQPQST